MPWLELTMSVRRRSIADAAFAVIDVVEMDDDLKSDTTRITESFVVEVPRMVADEALDVWAASAMGQCWATFRFNRAIRKLPEGKRREMQPPLFDEKWLS